MGPCRFLAARCRISNRDGLKGQRGEVEAKAPPPGTAVPARARRDGERAPRSRKEIVPMSGTTSRVSRAAALAHVQAIIAGLQKHLSGQSFMIGNVAFTTASLVLLLQSLADAIAGVITAQ